MLVCTHFRETSVVYESSGEINGCISGYIEHNKNNTLFIWQVAVDEAERGKGIALQMMHTILGRKKLSHIEYIETTISPSNKASQKLFRSLSSDLKIWIQFGYNLTIT